MTIGLLLVVGFVVIQLVMYATFRQWRARVEDSLQETIEHLPDRSLHDSNGDEVVAILRFSDDRKKVIWVLVVVFLGIFASCVLVVATGPPFLGDEAWLDFAMLFLIVDVGSAVPWIAFLNPYGNIRVVTRRGLIRRSPWFLGTQFVRWDQIRWVKWVPLGNAFILSTEKGMFLVYSFLQNIEVFANAVMTNLPEQKWKKAAEMLRKALSGPFQPTL